MINDELVIQYLKSRGLGNLAEQLEQKSQARHYASKTPETAVSEKQAKDDAAFRKSDRMASFKSEKEELGVLLESGGAHVEQGRLDETVASTRTEPSTGVRRRESAYRSRFSIADDSIVGAYAVGEESTKELLGDEYVSRQQDLVEPASSNQREIPAAFSDTEDPPPTTSIEATKVEDIVAVSAKPFEESKWTPKTITLLVLALGAVLASIIAVAVTQTKSPEPAPVPTTSPTMSPEARLAYITDIVANVSEAQTLSGMATFDMEGSPQYKALQWITMGDANQVGVDETDRIIQRYVLAVLFYSTNGDNWVNQFEFMTQDNECAWSGALQCNSKGLITDIDLRENGLEGPIPHELSALTALKSLVFDTNDLSGALPTILQELTSLTRLDLWSNKLVESIPRDFFTMTDLESFKVGRNSITGALPSEIGLLTKMTVLSLERNVLTGQVPESIWDLTNMRRFDADQQKLSGTVSPKIGEWLNLTHFAYLKLNITGTVSSSDRATEAEVLY